jgi:CheY-like chemotaxis protein
MSVAPRSVLLVDDEDDIRIVAATALGRLAGWDVVTAASGGEAVVRACTRPFDAVVLDVMMPGLDGPATLARLRSEPLTASVPVVFLTAKVQAEERARLAALGAAGVVSKPFDPTTLADQLAAALGWS